MDYLDWNNCIAAHFFSEEMAGRRVHLHVTRDLIERIGLAKEGSGGAESFVTAVKSGPPWAKSQGLCSRALEAIRIWRTRDLIYPPYIAYLSLFIAAASLEGDFAPNAYYPRLRTLLGENKSVGTYPRFDEMLWLWEDLERWSSVDKGGEWGVFRHHLYGGWIHVGLPIAQTLLSEDDHRALPTLFAQAGLDPAAPPAEGALATTLVRYGQGHLRSRTLRLLQASQSSSTEDASSARALIEIVLSELRDWDGASVAGHGADVEDTDSTSVLNGNLRLCCALDRIAGEARFMLRCKTSREFPDEGFILASPGDDAGGEGSFACEERLNGWSSPLEQRASGRTVDAGSWDWRAGTMLEDREQGWVFRWPGAPLRLLVDGQGEGLSGYAEVFRLPAHVPFFLLVYADVAAEITAWGQSSCDGWQEVNLSRGLPANWRMFSAQRARDDSAVRAKFPRLALPSSVSLVLRDGIKVGQGKRYFDFAPPLIEVQGAGDIQVFCNGEPMSPNMQGLYELPEQIASVDRENDKIEIVARCNGQDVGRTAFYLAREGWTWTGLAPGCLFDAFGSAMEETGSGAAGALVDGGDAPAFNFEGVVPLLEEGAVHYIGRQPGQITNWPQEPRPTNWRPVWVIVTRRGRGEAVFCGSEMGSALPMQGACSDRMAVKKWREFLWVHRKRIMPPAHVELRKLWVQYQEMAKNA
jgi:hypothetical protein